MFKKITYQGLRINGNGIGIRMVGHDPYHSEPITQLRKGNNIKIKTRKKHKSSKYHIIIQPLITKKKF